MTSQPARAPQITPFLWSDGTAEEMARFHADLFGGEMTALSRYPEAGQESHGQPAGQVMVVEYRILGHSMAALNGGPAFKLSPAVSFFVQLKDKAEVERIWAGLSKCGEVLMPLDAYDWSPLYGWCNDRYGASWQIAWHPQGEAAQALTPMLMFTGPSAGRAREALDFYAGVFPGSAVEAAVPYPPDAGEVEGAIMHGRANLSGQRMMAMDSSADHKFGFSEATSLVIRVTDQSELDFYWNRLIEGGGQHSRCGWLKDRFGVSWQVTPEVALRVLSGPDKDAARRSLAAVWGMTKIDIAAVEAAITERM